MHNPYTNPKSVYYNTNAEFDQTPHLHQGRTSQQTSYSDIITIILNKQDIKANNRQ